MNKRLILIRHAHRDTGVPDRDNGLSDKGKAQAKRITAHLLKRLEDQEAHLLSSPKKRCRETLGPFAKALGLELEIDERLTEASTAEGRTGFLKRMDEFGDEWRYQGPEVTVLCSHGDWIPIFVERLTGARIALKKGAIVEIEYSEAGCFLTSLIQKIEEGC